MLDKEVLKNAGIDYDDGVKRFNGNEKLYEKYLLKFTEDDNYNGSIEAMKNEDYDLALRTIHAMKGITGNLSMQDLHRDCCAVVDDIRAGDYGKSQEDFKSLQVNYERAEKILL